MTVSPAIPPWQADYLRGYQRTSGKTVQFIHQGHGWWRLAVLKGSPDRIGGKYRRADITAMTERLRQRADAGAPGSVALPEDIPHEA